MCYPQIFLSITILFLCSTTQADDPLDIVGIEKRLDSLETRINFVERDLEKLTGQSAACPCPEGPCICKDGECQCPDCPLHGKAKASGVRILLFTADWCAPCQAAKKRLGDMITRLEVIDCTDGNPCPEYGEILYPTCLKLVDGKIETRCVGEHVGPLIVGGWLGIEGNGQPAPAVKDSRIETPARFHYQMPTMYRPRYYYTPPTFSHRFYGNSCPTCR